MISRRSAVVCSMEPFDWYLRARTAITARAQSQRVRRARAITPKSYSSSGRRGVREGEAMSERAHARARVIAKTDQFCAPQSIESFAPNDRFDVETSNSKCNIEIHAAQMLGPQIFAMRRCPPLCIERTRQIFHRSARPHHIESSKIIESASKIDLGLPTL